MEQFIILAVLLTSSLMISSTGALLSEKSGIANISIEGNMVAGAMFYMIFNRMFLGTATDPSSISDGLLPFIPLISMFLASFCGMLLSSLFAIVAVRLNGDHIITGTAYNLFIPALSTVMMVTFYSNTSPSIPQQQAFDITGNMIIIYPILFLIISVIAISFVSFKFNKTKKGLRLIASGENPFALETSGISVMSTRFWAVMAAGFLSSMGGVMWVFGQKSGFSSTVFGMGFISVGIIIFAKWKTSGIFIGSIIMGILMAFGQSITDYPSIEVPKQIIQAIPYVLPIIILVISKSTGSPKSLGKPFKKDQR